MKQFSVIASVLFDQPMDLDGASVPIEGFSQTFWVTAESFGQAMATIETQLQTNNIQAIEGLLIGPEEISRTKLQAETDITQPGIFHTFERTLFGPQESAPKWWKFWER